MFELIFLALTIVILSGVLSTIEASLFSYSLSKARVEASKGKKLAQAALEIREKPVRIIATFVILSSTISYGGSIAVGSLASSQFESWGLGVFSAVLTFFAITFSEIIPKNIGERFSHIIFPLAALPLRWLAAVLSPAVYFFEMIVRPFTSGGSPFLTSEEEIALLTKVGAKEGVIEAHEAEMIQRVFKLNDVTAGDMMTPKPFVAFVDGNKTIIQVADFVKAATHSRFPVFSGDKNNIVGIVHQRDLSNALSAREHERKVSEFAREAVFIPESRLGDDLLRDFRAKKFSLGVVVSEYGNMIGVVGLEDILDELVGEVIDEKDVNPGLIKRVAKNEILAHGQTRVSAINHFFNLELKSRKNLNGFLLEKIGRLPEKGEAIELGELLFQIEEVAPNQIERVRITKKTEG